jgi:hypothetical protein
MNETEKFLKLEQELKPYIPLLGQAADVIINENVSKYPIFVVHQQELAMGIALIEANPPRMYWSVNASTLEEFVTKNLVFEEKIKDFMSTYKNPETHLCLFVLSELGAQFIFIPR